MEKPRPRSPLVSSITWHSELHMARPVRGSRLRLFMRLNELSLVAAVAEEAREPSDLAFTKRSEPGMRF